MLEYLCLITTLPALGFMNFCLVLGFANFICITGLYLHCFDYLEGGINYISSKLSDVSKLLVKRVAIDKVM